jgi:hypothetical protein
MKGAETQTREWIVWGALLILMIPEQAELALHALLPVQPFKSSQVTLLSSECGLGKVAGALDQPVVVAQLAGGQAALCVTVRVPVILRQNLEANRPRLVVVACHTCPGRRCAPVRDVRPITISVLGRLSIQKSAIGSFA